MVRIVTDSASDLELHEYEKLNVAYVPLFVIFGDKEYQENINLSKTEFYEMLENGAPFPRTSQPSPEAIEKVMREAMEAGDEMVIVSISSGLSGTYQGFCMVKEMLEYEKCYIVDSLTGTGGERLLVEYAAKLRDEGLTGAQIEEKLLEVRGRISLFTCMDTLEYLMKGGRISKSAYAVGTIANVKPIMHVTPDGRPEIPAKILGIRRGIDYLCKRYQEIEPDPQFPMTVMYTHNRKNGEVLADRLRKLGAEIPEDRIVNVGAVVGAHIGPNACATVYVAKEQQK